MDIKMKGIVTMAQERKDEPETIQGSLSETEQKTGREALPETGQRIEREMLPETEQRTGWEALPETDRRTERDVMSETPLTEEKQAMKSSGGSVFAGIYDQLPDISVKSVDRFILICAIALVAVILVGVLKANHIF